MAKKITKEIIIILLISLAIILILGVLLYEYVPSNKIIPNQVAYTTPADVQEELSKSENVENEEVILTYSVDSTDLNNYERINIYVPGKPNPFSPYNGVSTSGEDTTQNNNSNINSENSTQSNQTNSPENSTQSNNVNNSENATEQNLTTTNSQGSVYYPDTGTK